MGSLFSIRPSLSIKGRKFKGLRGWAGKPLHPPLTDFPIVGYVLAAVFDVLSFALEMQGKSELAQDFFAAGTFVLVAGFVVSLGAAITGFWDWWKGVERRPDSGPLGKAKHTQVWRTVNWHMTVMLTVTAIVIVDLLVRTNQTSSTSASVTTMALSLAAAILVSFGAMYGGSLVYDYQFNVESLDGSTAWDETEVDQYPADKPQSDW